MEANMRTPPDIAEVQLDGEPMIIRILLGSYLTSSNEKVEKMNRIDINARNWCYYLEREEQNAKM